MKMDLKSVTNQKKDYSCYELIANTNMVVCYLKNNNNKLN